MGKNFTHQDSKADKSAAAEDNDSLHKALASGWERHIALHLPVDGGNGPWEANAEENVDRVGPSDVAKGCISGVLLDSCDLGGKCVRKRRSESNECDGGHGLGDTGNASEHSSELSDDSCEGADVAQADDEGKPSTSKVRRRNGGKQDLPEDCEEVHDAVRGCQLVTLATRMDRLAELPAVCDLEEGPLLAGLQTLQAAAELAGHHVQELVGGVHGQEIVCLNDCHQDTQGFTGNLFVIAENLDSHLEVSAFLHGLIWPLKLEDMLLSHALGHGSQVQLGSTKEVIR